MHWRTTDDVNEFLAAAGDWLRARPVQNTLLLTLAEAARLGSATFGPPASRFGWCEAERCAFVQVPSRPFVLSTMSDRAAAALAGHLADAGTAVAGVNAEPDAAQAFARAWGERTGAGARGGPGARLYRLDRLTAPDPAPAGRGRTATPADHDQLVAWHLAFARELGETPHDPSALVEQHVRKGTLTVWDVDGAAVSMAGRQDAVAGMVRIGPVYTPPERRGRGYGAGVTAAASRAVLDAGAAEVVLFTDPANPTSNGIYQRIGYRPVIDRVVVEFGGQAQGDRPGGAR
jgi:ribosomal protein S18 acetylase RimI-like enzyme